MLSHCVEPRCVESLCVEPRCVESLCVESSLSILLAVTDVNVLPCVHHVALMMFITLLYFIIRGLSCSRDHARR